MTTGEIKTFSSQIFIFSGKLSYKKPASRKLHATSGSKISR